MSFYHLTPEEFEKVYNKWYELHDNANQNAWEQTRIQCYYAVRPYMKGNISLRAFMPLRWDTKAKNKKTSGEKLHDIDRFNRLKKEYGSEIPIHG